MNAPSQRISIKTPYDPTIQTFAKITQAKSDSDPGIRSLHSLRLSTVHAFSLTTNKNDDLDF